METGRSWFGGGVLVEGDFFGVDSAAGDVDTIGIGAAGIAKETRVNDKYRVRRKTPKPKSLELLP